MATRTLLTRRTTPQRTTQRLLLLRRFPYGESSLVLHALTPDWGRVSLLAKGAYRQSSGFHGVFDLFDTLVVRWSMRPGRELGLVTSAVLETRRPAIATDLARYRAALSLLELAGLTAREEHEETALFHWLEASLDLLQRGTTAPELVRIAADLALLRVTGLAPSLGRCASCGSSPTDKERRDVFFSAALGGRLCARCAGDASRNRRAVGTLPLNVLRIAESLMAATPPMLEHVRIERGLLERVGEFVERFLEYHLESRLRCRARPAPRGVERTRG